MLLPTGSGAPLPWARGQVATSAGGQLMPSVSLLLCEARFPLYDGAGLH